MPAVPVPSEPLRTRHSTPAVPFLLVMSHPPYHICPQRNAPRLPDLNSPCITFRLAALTHLACVTLPSSPRPTRTLLACHALTIHCPSVQNSPYRCTHSIPAKPCHFTSSPAMTDPSMPAVPPQSPPCRYPPYPLPQLIGPYLNGPLHACISVPR